LGCAGRDFDECWTLALSIQDLDQKSMHLLMEIKVVMLFHSRCASIYGQEIRSRALCKFSSSTSQRLSMSLKE